MGRRANRLTRRVFNKILCFKAYWIKLSLASCGCDLRLWGHCVLKNPERIRLGNSVLINDGVYINGLGGVVVGDDVSISAKVIILSTSLDPDRLTRRVHIKRRVFIGHHVQIGAGAIVLPGVTIGNNVMIGAGAVVTKDVHSGAVVVGNPARILRSLPVDE